MKIYKAMLAILTVFALSFWLYLTLTEFGSSIHFATSLLSFGYVTFYLSLKDD